MRYGVITATITLSAYMVLYLALTMGGGFGRLQLVPTETAETFPHVIAVVNLVTVVLLQLGYRYVKKGRIRSHAIMMGSAFILITVFLILYVLKVATLGAEIYEGPEWIRNFVYLPALTVHLALSIVSVPLVVYNALTGVTLKERAGRSQHRRSGRIAYPAWSISLALGLLVYALLRLHPV
ncbi:MAG: DUF420 domain-containing protein [Nitrososphaerota archaeon]